MTAASGGGGLASTMLVPRVAPDTAGRFRVWLATQAPTKATHMHLLWDRKTEGGFPELKELVRCSLLRRNVVCATKLRLHSIWVILTSCNH